GVQRPLPDFDPQWLQSTPRVVVSAHDIGLDEGDSASNVRSMPARPSRVMRVLLAAAAALFLVSGIVGVYFFTNTQINPRQPSSAVVLHTDGKAYQLTPEIYRQYRETNQWPTDQVKSIQKGDQIPVNNWVLTWNGAETDLALPGGFLMRLKENSALHLEKLADPAANQDVTASRLDRGSVLNVIARMDAETEFTVQTPTVIAGVRGTTFRISAIGDQTEVHVVRGSVHIAPVAVEPGAETRPDNTQSDEVAGAEPDEIPTGGLQFEPFELYSNEVVRLSPDRPRPAVQLSQDEEFRDEQDLNELARRVSSSEEYGIDDSPVDIESMRESVDLQRRQLYAEIRLKNGAVFQGIVVSQVGNRVYIEREDSSQVFQAEEIDEINYLNMDSGAEPSVESPAGEE
ncbi:MAG: FecR domain-containing protein, partial [Leptospiraceae bacterium]|nr:FecR domain-containing protein [Leptospiraceae bacterium]